MMGAAAPRLTENTVRSKSFDLEILKKTSQEEEEDGNSSSDGSTMYAESSATGRERFPTCGTVEDTICWSSTPQSGATRTSTTFGSLGKCTSAGLPPSPNVAVANSSSGSGSSDE